MDAMTLSEIEGLTKRYAEARTILSDRVEALTRAMEDAKRHHLRGIKGALGKAAEAEGALRAAIEAGPELFAKPKTIIMSGIKVGYRKATGKLVWDDADAVIARIKVLHPYQTNVLIITRESPSKPSLAQLSVAELKRLGVRVIETGEEIVIAPTDTEVDKLVDALLREAVEDERPEAA